jgi:hypothetical protein
MNAHLHDLSPASIRVAVAAPDLLTPAALAFLAGMHARLDASRLALLASRR